MKTLFSKHILFFAFRWRPASERGGRNSGISEVLKAVQEAGWKSVESNPVQNYSEYNYLHDFARRAVFESPSFDKNAAPGVYNFQKNISEKFQLSVRNQAIGSEPPELNTTFELAIARVRLNLYEPGVGVLSLMLDNPTYAEPKIILIINDLARRLYPQYLDWETGIAKPREQGIIPVSVGFKPFLEDFSVFPTDSNRQGMPTRFLPKYILGLLGNRFKASEKEASPADFVVEHEFDDRQFMLCCLLNDELSKQLKGHSKNGKYHYLNDQFWYAYIFADKDEPSIKNAEMMESLLSSATYSRWSEDGTLFGASRYSFVALTAAKNGWLMGPMSGNYARLVELCLMQRAAVLRFREDTASIATRLSADENPRQVTKQIRRLYGDFIRFSNQFNFQEATTYEQGIELYDLLRRQMRVTEQTETLKTELEAMHNYATELHEESRSRALDWLTILGAVFLVPSFLLSYFGFYDTWKKNWEQCHILLISTVLLGIGMALAVFYSGLLRRTGWHRILGIILLFAYLAVAIFMPLLLEWFPQWFGIQKQ